MSDLAGSTAPAGAAEPASSSASRHHPIGFWFFFWGEFAERSSYYGMRTILVVYLSTAIVAGGLGLSDPEAGSVVSWFKMSCFLLPVVGGMLADRIFGKYWTIVGFSIPYVLGHFLLGIPTWQTVIMALLLLAAGSGVIKPNISALMGETYDQQRPGQERLRSAAFMWYYLAINIGALISQLVLPELRTRYGFALAFQFPTWLMVVSLAIFAAGKPWYAKEAKPHLLSSQSSPPDWRALGRLWGIFGLMVFFWIGYEFNDTIWIFFVRDYVDLEVTVRWGGSLLSKSVPPEQLQFINPLCVLLMVPLFNMLFRWLDPQARRFTSIRKILVGFGLGAAASATMTVAALAAQDGSAKISLLWPAAAYVVLTAGEVLLYGTGLELSYALAPKNMKGLVTACFVLTAAVANLANTFLVKLYGGSLKDSVADRGPLSPLAFFGLATLVGLAATIAFYFVGRRFETNLRSQSSVV